MGFSVQNWFSELNKGNVILAYKGSITSSLITNSLDTVEKKLDAQNESSKIRKKVYNVLVECLQNIYHHLDDVPGETKELGSKFAVFIIIKIEESFNILTGNFVQDNKVQMLADRMDQINSLSTDELKSLYKLILNNEEFSIKGGGGLGMIDIARKTGSKLDYHFYKYKDGYSFFSLNIVIS